MQPKHAAFMPSRLAGLAETRRRPSRGLRRLVTAAWAVTGALAVSATLGVVAGLLASPVGWVALVLFLAAFVLGLVRESPAW